MSLQFPIKFKLVPLYCPQIRTRVFLSGNHMHRIIFAHKHVVSYRSDVNWLEANQSGNVCVFEKRIRDKCLEVIVFFVIIGKSQLVVRLFCSIQFISYEISQKSRVWERKI